MKDLVLILQLLEEATRELSSEQTVPCSKIILLLSTILTELRRNLIDEDEAQNPADNETQVHDDDETQVPESQGSNIPRSEESQQVITGLIESIERRWHNFEEDDIYSVSTLLDPRFKEAFQ